MEFETSPAIGPRSTIAKLRAIALPKCDDAGPAIGTGVAGKQSVTMFRLYGSTVEAGELAGFAGVVAVPSVQVPLLGLNNS